MAIPPTGMGGDNDFLKSEANLRTVGTNVW